MDFTFIGTGTAAPKADQRPSCVYFRTESLSGLLDLGAGAVHSMAGIGIDPMEIENVFFSHFHSDHISDLIMLLHSNNATPGKVREKPLNLYGPRGLKALTDAILQLFPETVPESYGLFVNETGPDEVIRIGDARVSCCRTGHTDYSIGYRFELQDGTFVYTGDSAYSKTLAGFCRKTDILITECSYTDECRTCDHLCVSEVGRLAKEAETRQLIVVHRYPQTAGTDILQEIREFYAGPVCIPDDGDIYEG